ncbi:MAG: hypothetical protein KatS3mg111_2131 [Pirellulaceae bacterium]|nr:MAG: hypothetical protein KatS3mg111_2131 [Pirellulaceae bacterium]
MAVMRPLFKLSHADQNGQRGKLSDGSRGQTAVAFHARRRYTQQLRTLSPDGLSGDDVMLSVRSVLPLPHKYIHLPRVDACLFALSPRGRNLSGAPVGRRSPGHCDAETFSDNVQL